MEIVCMFNWPLVEIFNSAQGYFSFNFVDKSTCKKYNAWAGSLKNLSVKTDTGLCSLPGAVVTTSIFLFGMFEISNVLFKAVRKASKQFSVVPKSWSSVLSHSL